jgi:putative peptide zinc metalloprotease protein
MAVSAAGMIVELVIAAVALIAWWHLQPGLLQTWCLSLVLVCSVGTLLVNANPLLRYDGYYLLSDGVEVPNLAGRAQGLLPAALRRWLWAEPRTADALLSPGQQRWLWVYALAGRVYLTLVLLGIFALLFSWARVYRLENLVILLAGVTLAGMVAGPALAMGRLLRNPGMRFRLRKPRAAALTLVLLALLAAFCFWPVTGCVRAPAVMVPAGAQPVYATTAGTLHYAVPVGTRVEAGEVIARLSQVELELALLRQQGVCGEYRVHVQQLATMRSWNDQASLSLPTVRAEWAAARGRAEKLEAQVAELTIRAPVDGVVIAPPAVAGGERDPSLLPDWTGVPLEPKNLGCRIESGTLLCMVAEPTALEALVAVDQSDADQVQPGQRVRLLLESSPLEPLTGQVVQVARRSEFRQQIHPAVEAGKYHLVQVRLELPPISPLVGARGVAQVEGQASTLSALVVDALRALFRLSW